MKTKFAILHRLNSFTLLETIIVLALSSMVIFFIYQLVYWSSGLFHSISEQEQKSYTTLSFICQQEKDFFKANSIILSKNEFLFYSDKELFVSYVLAGKHLVRNQDQQTDTLLINQAAVQKVPETSLVKSLSLNIVFQDTSYNYLLEKTYTAKEVLNYEN